MEVCFMILGGLALFFGIAAFILTVTWSVGSALKSENPELITDEAPNGKTAVVAWVLWGIVVIVTICLRLHYDGLQ